MFGWPVAIFNWLGAMFNLNLFYFLDPEPPALSAIDVAVQALENHLGTLLLLLIYIILHLSTNYLSVFLKVRSLLKFWFQLLHDLYLNEPWTFVKRTHHNVISYVI